MKHLFLQLFASLLLTLTIPSVSIAGLMTGNYKPANNNTNNQPTSNIADDIVTATETELSGVVTGNFYEPEGQVLAQGVVTGNFRTSSGETPILSTIAAGVMTGNFYTIAGSDSEIKTDTWYESDEYLFRWLVREDLVGNIEFLVETNDDNNNKETYVISVDLQ